MDLNKLLQQYDTIYAGVEAHKLIKEQTKQVPEGESPLFGIPLYDSKQMKPFSVICFQDGEVTIINDVRKGE